ncbi:Txe/YoeB family addiction module toxin [Runella slithyformis]|uniref:Putative mRNA interferase YoeB n=1 Tax=Runella slithyformis (strain ATCC 29530 / DSM 19594 / LMG 11500 / NCIMB 11436 / LSU 4) TaxID=761193 RepID=A0A7U4E4H0_RUNSL|nr:Txe/YoeB family addiction module toxin [Runella slithyformis]AEI47516.1 addiction module toxin, Txe/YoeB family [Runella slithyformis DSM 19594]
MSYRLDFTKQAQNDIDFHKKSGNKAVLKKLLTLLEELSEHPFTGTGKPEALKYDLAELWSRRINHEHRLIYEVAGDTIVIILAARGHYQ